MITIIQKITREVASRNYSHFGSSESFIPASLFCFPCKTSCHASQRMVLSRDAHRMVSIHSWAASKGGAVAKATIFVFVVAAARWPVASFDVSKTSGAT